ncbi:CsbD family protein [Azotobacter salinestris]|uniref:CsbD family protein n=1 Tax=Azotobacter salinestris TaxID=69964 RepID=UPI0032DEFA10
MGSTSDKIKGNANEAAGKIKKGIGGATDNPALESEGRAQESRGKGQQVKGDVKDSIKRGIDRA